MFRHALVNAHANKGAPRHEHDAKGDHQHGVGRQPRGKAVPNGFDALLEGEVLARVNRCIRHAVSREEKGVGSSFLPKRQEKAPIVPKIGPLRNLRLASTTRTNPLGLILAAYSRRCRAYSRTDRPERRAGVAPASMLSTIWL